MHNIYKIQGLNFGHHEKKIGIKSTSNYINRNHKKEKLLRKGSKNGMKMQFILI